MFNVVGSSGFEDIDSISNPGYDRLFGALQSGNVTIYGNDYSTYDKTCERDYVSLKDVCNAFIKGVYLLSHKKIQEVINICTGLPQSVLSLIYIWNKKSTELKLSSIHNNIHLPYITYTYGLRRQGDPDIVYGSNMKAINTLNWNPTKKIEDIILDLAYDKKL